MLFLARYDIPDIIQPKRAITWSVVKQWKSCIITTLATQPIAVSIEPKFPILSLLQQNGELSSKSMLTF
jgi:hypothetical protein